MMSFDIKSLCTSIPLNKIRITLERKDQKEVNTDIPKTIKKECTKDVHFYLRMKFTNKLTV